MKRNINQYDFERAFVDMGRGEQFSYEGKRALFEYLEQYEVDCGVEIELDVIALCCEYTEYADLAEFQDNYGTDYDDMESIQDSTSVIDIDGTSFIIQDF